MTIQFQGHIDGITRGPSNGTIQVIVKPEVSAIAEEFVTLIIPITQASHWLLGNRVDFTAHSSAPGTPQIGTPQQEDSVAG